jgi:hypothetical protein
MNINTKMWKVDMNCIKIGTKNCYIQYLETKTLFFFFFVWSGLVDSLLQNISSLTALKINYTIYFVCKYVFPLNVIWFSWNKFCFLILQCLSRNLKTRWSNYFHLYSLHHCFNQWNLIPSFINWGKNPHNLCSFYGWEMHPMLCWSLLECQLGFNIFDWLVVSLLFFF